jgi:hypothetical protein
MRFAKFIYLVPGQRQVIRLPAPEPTPVTQAPRVAGGLQGSTQAEIGQPPQGKPFPALLVAGLSTVAIGSTTAVLALSQDRVMRDAAAAGDNQTLDAAHRRQVGFGLTSYALWGAGATCVTLHFAL